MRGTSAIVSPVAGFSTANVSPESDSSSSSGIRPSSPSPPILGAYPSAATTSAAVARVATVVSA